MCPQNILHYKFFDKDLDVIVDPWGVVIEGDIELLTYALFDDGLLDTDELICSTCENKVIVAIPLIDMLFTRLPASRPDIY